MKINQNISIIIPAYNEELRLQKSLEKIYSFFHNTDFKYEVIVISDGSTDKTVKAARDKKHLFENMYIIEKQFNRGKGHAVKLGMLKAKGDYVCFTDADLSTPISDINKLVNKLKDGHDIVIGSRKIVGDREVLKQKWYRRIMGDIFNKIICNFITSDFKDTQCGFKIFTKEASEKIANELFTSGFGFDVELLLLARIFNFKVAEIPVNWSDDQDSRVSPIKDSLKMLREVLRINRYYFRKNYLRWRQV